VKGTIVDEVKDAALARLTSDINIRSDIEVFKEIELLVNEGDAGAGCIVDGQRRP
jgi:hypothetical protein